MPLNQIKRIFPVIKVISTILITSAIFWELGNVYATFTHQTIPTSFNVIFWVGRFALTAHFIEGIIAAFYAPTKSKTPIQYGIYTFFVGTIGLLELFLENDESVIKKV
ncbi:MAG: hypothetical protein KME23_03920 [Goleter apudmare HA4340-LM2]|jgi:hypothetical protein|nr:hypothetical protein [Goleter apudmare HA4340-LM2]